MVLIATIDTQERCLSLPIVFRDMAATWARSAGVMRWNGQQHTALLRQRVEVYEAAKAKHPERWSDTPRNWQRVQVVHLNPDHHVVNKPTPKEDVSVLKQAA